MRAFWEYLDGLGLFHMDMGLGRMHAALRALDLAGEDGRPGRPGGPAGAWTEGEPGVSPVAPSFLSVQVVGTNGKGSTSAMLAEMLQAAGLATGLYTSPHFLSPRERIVINGRTLPDADWLAAAEAVLAHTEDLGPERRLTYFELLTVMAAWLFRERGCRAAVFEAGLGGAHDATTALAHQLTVFTPIGLDHQHIIGPTLADIAKDKAGAIKPGVPAVTGFQPVQAAAVLTRTARDCGVFLREAGAIVLAHGQEWPTTPALAGPHQAGNLRLALAAYWLLATAQGLPVIPAALRQAAERAFVPGRMQFVSLSSVAPATDPTSQTDLIDPADPAGPTVPTGTAGPACPTGPEARTLILDAAHNEPGLVALRQALDALSIAPKALIFACLKDKNLEAMLPLVRSLTAGPILVPPIDAPGRALDPAELAQRLGPAARPMPSMQHALDALRGLAGPDGPAGPTLLCGSIYLLAQAYRLHPEWLER